GISCQALCPLLFLFSVQITRRWMLSKVFSDKQALIFFQFVQVIGPSPVPMVRSRRSTLDSQCSLRSILLQVRDLGLGYDSDETVLFKYCSGMCPHARSNHDLTLTNLLMSGLLPQPAPGELWHNTPCCRPTHHEDMAFLDNSHRWHKVEKLSAADCSCVG
uniref:Artemin n=1 Tax=Labrus bergylta TaxID=56723 RepID=A0A3Q3FC52_9LABR